MADLQQDLAAVVEALELATPGEWRTRATRNDDNQEWEIANFGGHHLRDADVTVVADVMDYCKAALDDAIAMTAAVNFIRKNHAAIAEAVRDARRYRWLRSLDGSCDAAACVNFNIGFDWIEQHGDELDAAIDRAREGE